MGRRLTDLDAVAQAELVRAGDASPLELVDAAIEALERLEARLNLLVHRRFEQARAEAAALGAGAGPFAGVPVLVKDFDGTTAGDPYRAGSAHLGGDVPVPAHDGHLQARLRGAGMIVLGRTATPELGLLPVTEPLAGGPTRNPWSPALSPGGSSGGSAAAVAARAVAVAHGGDGGGSLRIPASACGIVGLLPSRGRVSLGPDVGEAWGGLVRRHVLTRSVRDTAAVLDAVHGWVSGDPYGAPTPARPYAREVGADPGRRRIGVLAESPAHGVDVHPECRAALDVAAGLLVEAGHDVEHLDGWFLPPSLQDVFADRFLTVYLASAAHDVDELGRLAGTPAGPATVEPLTWALAEAGRQVSAPRYLQALEDLRRCSRRLARWWEDGHDLLVTPTLPRPPVPLGALSAPAGDPWSALVGAAELVSFTAPFNVTGQPAISLPLHWSADELPVGVQLVAAYGREDLLVQVAAQLEALRPWSDRVPPIHA